MNNDFRKKNSNDDKKTDFKRKYSNDRRNDFRKKNSNNDKKTDFKRKYSNDRRNDFRKKYSNDDDRKTDFKRKFNNYGDRRNDFRKKYSNDDDRKSDFKRKFNNYGDRRNDFRKKYSNDDDRKTDFKRKFNNYGDRRNDFRKKYSNDDDRKSDFKRKFNNYGDRRNDFRKKYSNDDDRKSDFKRKFNNYGDRRNDFRKKYSNDDDRKTDFKRKFNNYGDRRNDFRKKYSNDDDRKSDFKRKFNNYGDRRNDFRKKYSNDDDRKSDFKRKFNNYGDRRNDFRKKYSNDDDRKSDFKRKFNNYGDRRNDFRKKYSNDDDRKTDFKRKFNNYGDRRNDFRKKYSNDDDRKTDFKRKFNNNKENDELEKKNDENNNENDENLYNPTIIENEIIELWEKEYKPFEIKEITKDTFTVLLPPPNVTGSLHLGHALNCYIQDVIVRWKKLNNKKTIWIPGFDHAGIATEILVNRWIKNNNFVLNEETNLQYYFNKWTNKQKENIKKQWKRLGLAINLEFETFTLSEIFKKNVTKSFVTLFNDGLIYQNKKIVNWDPVLKTAISNIEVIRKEEKSNLYYFKYYLKEDPEKFIPIATTRPETMFADQAIIISSKDKRYQDWIGKTVINPLTEEEIPIIVNDEIDIEFGSGVVKCTPGHDLFDFEVGLKNNLEITTCFDDNGKMTTKNQYKGLDRLKARPRIVKELTQKNALIKIQSHTSNIPYSSRTNERIEPYIKEQWFISTKKWAEELISKKEEINLYPKKYNKFIWKWLENIQDWCISRQLNWGHKLPVYFNKETKEIKVSEIKLDSEIWKQSTDVLDTWFSSGLWSLINYGWNNEEKKEFEKLLPIDYLVTSYDIIFFWIVRMLFLHSYFKKELPFKKILIHGLIRTEQGKKMSKSKGNVINPLELIETFGSDALRLYLIGQHRIGEDLKYSNEKLVYSSQILNKLWNINKFISKDELELKNDFDPLNNKEEHNIWIHKEFIKIYKNNIENFENHLFSVVVQNIIGFTYKIFSNNYLRIIWALSINSKKTNETILTMKWIWKKLLLLFHPFIPFLSEKLFLNSFKNSIINEILDININFQFKETKLIDQLNEIIKLGREEQKEAGFEQFRILIYTENQTKWNKIKDQLNEMLLPFKLKIDKVFTSNNEKLVFKLSRRNNNNNNRQYRKDPKKEKEFILKEIERSKDLLNNENFVQKAKKELVEKEKEKLKYYLKKLDYFKE